jgi:hypothetical protein
MKSEYVNLIKQLDSLMILARTEWIEAPILKKHTWERKMDDILDERLRLMKLRDSHND